VRWRGGTAEPAPQESRALTREFFRTIEALKKQLNNKKDGAAREKALVAISAIASHAEVSAHVEPYLVALLPIIFAAAGDKLKPVQNAAESAAVAVAEAINANAVKAIIAPIQKSLVEALKWQEKMVALKFLDAVVKRASHQVSFRVPDLIPVVSETMWDTKKEVKARAIETMGNVCALIVNRDIEKFIPELISCIEKPEKVPDTVHVLGATTFVTDVHEPTLALMVPLLDRGLADRETSIKRKAAVIIDNMCKLVEDPNIVAPFLPKMMPGLQKNYDNMADPEAREKTKQALETLCRVGNVVDGKIPEARTDGAIDVVLGKLKTILAAKHAKAADNMAPVLAYVAAVGGQLVDEKEASAASWAENVKPYVTVIVGDNESAAVTEALRRNACPDAHLQDEEEEDEEEGEDLCNCTFNLAYGAKTLLNGAALRLKRGQRYGLCGPNGSGKSTLMRAINNEQVEGFPKQSEVKTVFVEHDLDSADTEMTTIDWTMKKLAEAEVDTPKEQVMEKLVEFGFSPAMVAADITSLSGGWKMKLALCRAVFESPDILLLDEPTNHLDVVNVKWLEDYLTNSPCTSIIVSHDTDFLDNVCQHILHYERFKLKRYRGNLREFVRKCPKAQSYYELGASEMEFTFPAPGVLEGVKTKAKAILRANKMGFQYQGTSKPQLSDITFQCSLGSRIAVIGPNGAGKSTLVNVLTGELVPTSGEIWQHENIRIAYIKQHAFAHIDDHLEKTAFEYIEWRFRSGEDRETMDRANKKMTEDDEKAMEKIFRINGTERRVVSIGERRKHKNTYEYKCSFFLGENVGQKNERWTGPMMGVPDEEAWIPRGDLINSHGKMLADVDQKAALESGQFRALTKKEVAAHATNFGLDQELVMHTKLKALSGGQRVKVVLAACTWQRPHLIVLDEPTNYLDRDSLGALSKALKKFEGGVIIITHSAEFTKDLTEEVWAVMDGKMTPSGHNWVQGQGSGPRLSNQEGGEDDQFDAMGNKIEVTKKKKLSSNEKRKNRKGECRSLPLGVVASSLTQLTERMAKKKKGEDLDDDDDF
jgi:elongation factor 3